MAISYSYPMGTPKLTDTVLGVQYEEMKDPVVKNFSIDDIVVLAAGEITPIPGPAGPQGLQGVAGAQGLQGIQGTPGEIGPAGLTWEGAWNKNISYAEDDAVGYGGASYFCILAIPGSILNDNPLNDTTHWALLAAQGAKGLQGIQGPQGLQGIQGAQGIQGVAGVAATQTLQQTVDLGNTISGIAGGVTFTTTLTKSSIKIGESVNSGITLNPGQFVCEKNGGSDLMILQFPAVYSGINQITLPALTGTAALTSDITLQNAFNNGNTMAQFNFEAGVFDSVNGFSVENTTSLEKATLETNKITLTKNLFGLKTTNIFQAISPTVNRAIYFPDADGTIALTSNITQQKTTSFTAVNDQYYSSNGTLTVTDPTGATNRGYIVHVVGGTSTIGGVGYITGALVYRYYNGTTWLSTNMADKTPVYKAFTALLTQTGTNDPTFIVLENTTGATVNITRTTTGIYNILFSSSVLTTNKTSILVNSFDSNNRTIFGQISGSTFAQITTRNAGATIDGVLDNTTVEIKVYP